ncbi:MAG TPA: hypothetical protein VLE70_07550 [Anaerolineae bacterium]|jgi:hypothetical protein|nr:hypothetical protein [Anaerolineae bacterium]
MGNKHSTSISGSKDSGLCRGTSRPEQCYEIRFKGHLDEHWAAWFHGCSLTREEDGTTTMIAPVVDQAELFGLLNKVRDLSLSLISVSEVKPNDSPGPDEVMSTRRYKK